MIIEMRENLLTRGGVYILCVFQKGHKKWHPTIFFSNLFINEQAIIISGKKNY